MSAFDMCLFGGLWILVLGNLVFTIIVYRLILDLDDRHRMNFSYLAKKMEKTKEWAHQVNPKLPMLFDKIFDAFQKFKEERGGEERPEGGRPGTDQPRA